MLGSLALLLKFRTEAGRAGVAFWKSNPILLGATFCLLILSCLVRCFKFPVPRTELFLFPALVRPLSSARFDSTLLHRALPGPRPSILGCRGLLLKFAMDNLEVSTIGVCLSRRLTSTDGLLDSRSISSKSPLSILSGDVARSTTDAFRVDSLAAVSKARVSLFPGRPRGVATSFPLPLLIFADRTLVAITSSGSLISVKLSAVGIAAGILGRTIEDEVAGFLRRGAGADGATFVRLGRGILAD